MRSLPFLTHCLSVPASLLSSVVPDAVGFRVLARLTSVDAPMDVSWLSSGGDEFSCVVVLFLSRGL